jgi:hypothetical protein
VDRREAEGLLEQQLETYRSRSYKDLTTLVGGTRAIEVRGQTGTSYQLEIEVFWDDQPGHEIRVVASIDGGGWRAFAPITLSLLIGSDHQGWSESRRR